mmetsp:Transcript_40266/g.38734  ORF Transcript_40266/g.38734 Transcript_40266/m.38734 type:complete len:114 (+) Transcript_40266:724-1065(+)
MHKQAQRLDENRVVLYKKGQQLGMGFYVIEISSNRDGFYIAAFDIETPESFMIQIPESKAKAILQEFSNNLEFLASSLRLTNNKLILMSPKFWLKNEQLRRSEPNPVNPANLE